MSLTRTLLRAGWRAVAFLFGLLFAFYVLAGLLGFDVLDMRFEPAPDPVAEMVDKHDCWTGTAPTDTEPAKAVVSYVPGKPRLVDAEVGFGIWLDDQPGTLHAFCPGAAK